MARSLPFRARKVRNRDRFSQLGHGKRRMCPRPSLLVTALEPRVMLSGRGPSDPGTLALDQIDHFVIIYQENWSFDSLYGDFPGANGLDNADGAGTIPQVDKSGNLLATLPDP